MNKLISAITFLFSMPAGAAICLAAINLHAPIQLNLQSSVSRPEAEMIAPIVFNEPKYIVLDEVVIAGKAPAKIAVPPKEYVCGNWREEQLVYGMVKACDWK